MQEMVGLWKLIKKKREQTWNEGRSQLAVSGSALPAGAGRHDIRGSLKKLKKNLSICFLDEMVFLWNCGENVETGYPEPLSLYVDTSLNI